MWCDSSGVIHVLYAVLYAHRNCYSKEANICSHCLKLVAIGYKYATGCHDNGNVGLHVCAKFHDHTYTVLCAHSKG